MLCICPLAKGDLGLVTVISASLALGLAVLLADLLLLRSNNLLSVLRPASCRAAVGLVGNTATSPAGNRNIRTSWLLSSYTTCKLSSVVKIWSESRGQHSMHGIQGFKCSCWRHSLGLGALRMSDDADKYMVSRWERAFSACE